MLKLEYLIYLYMLLCACMMIFNIIYISYNKYTEKFSKKEKNKIYKELDRHVHLLKCGTHLTVKHRKKLFREFKNINNLMKFEQFMDNLDDKFKQRYIEETKYIFCDLAEYYKNRNSIEKSYYIYIIGKYKIFINMKSKNTMNIILEFLNEESIYCRYNTLKTIMLLENEKYIEKALKIISKSPYEYPSQIIFNNFENYSGGVPIGLISALWRQRRYYNENIKIALIKYIKNKKLDYNEEFKKILENKKTSKKIKIEIIKYYRYNIYEEIKDKLIEYLNLRGWENKEIIIETTKTLSNYGSEETKEALKKLLKRKDWDIRTNALDSLIEMGASYMELTNIYNKEDEITKQILRYKIQSKNRYRKLKRKEIKPEKLNYLPA